MKKINYKSALVGVAAAAMAFAATSAQAETLKIYNWAEYLGETNIEDFTKETGIEVVLDTYDSVETIDAKLMAGKTGYDVVDHSSGVGQKLIGAGILHKIDKSKISTYGNIRKDLLQKMEQWDPGNEYYVPYMWGTNGVTVVPSEVEKVLPNAPRNLDLVFKPENMEKIAQCGVAFLDSPEDIIPMAMAYLGKDPYSTDKSEYDAAADLLNSVRPYIKTFDNYAYTRLAEKEFCVMVTWGPDGLLAQDTATEAGLDLKVDFFTHPGAANLWIDSWMIPSDAANVDGAHKWIEFMNRPEQAAAASNFTWYANAVPASNELIDEAVLNSKAVYPSDEEVATMFMAKTLPQKITRVKTRIWTKFKSGN